MIFVLLAKLLHFLRGNRAVGNVNVCRIDIDMVEQMLPHEADVALQLIGLHGVILVEVERHDIAKREFLFAMNSQQFVINADRRTTGGQTQHTITAFRLPRAN